MKLGISCHNEGGTLILPGMNTGFFALARVCWLGKEYKPVAHTGIVVSQLIKGSAQLWIVVGLFLPSGGPTSFFGPSLQHP